MNEREIAEEYPFEVKIGRRRHRESRKMSWRVEMEIKKAVDGTTESNKDRMG